MQREYAKKEFFNYYLKLSGKINIKGGLLLTNSNETKKMLEKFKIKATQLNYLVVITSIVIVLLELIDTFITYTTLKTFLTSPIGNFVEAIIFAYIIYLLLTKDKTVEALFILLFIVLIPYGISFIQGVLYSSLNLGSFSGIKRLFIFGLMISGLIFFIKEIKKGIPSLNFSGVTNSSYFIITISYLAVYLIFFNLSPVIYVALFLYIFIVINEEQLIPFALIYLTVMDPFNLIDTFIFESRIGGSIITPFASWLNMLLMIAILVLAIIHIYKPTIFKLKKGELNSKENVKEVSNNKEN